MGDFGGLFGAEQVGHQGQAEFQGGAGAAGRHQAAIDDHAFGAEARGQFGGDAGVGGVTAVREQAGVEENGGRGADGGEPAAGGGLALQGGAQAEIGTEVFHSGTAGEENAVEGVGETVGQQSVGDEDETVAAGDGAIRTEGGDDDLGAGTAEHVDGRDGFQFFKAGGQGHEHGRHGRRVGGERRRRQLFSIAEPAALALPAGMNASASASARAAGPRLVVFGCGYVGAATAAWAQARGATVTALTRNPATAAALRAAGIEVVVADLAGSDWHAAIPGGAEWVLNSVSSGGGGIDGYRRSYVEGTRSVVAWARSAGGIGTLVYTGSTSVYPQGDGAAVDETAPTDAAGERPGLLLAAEAAVRGAEAEAGCRRSFVLRLAGIYGPGRHHVLDQLRSGAGEIAGAGSHRLNLVHRDDIVGAIAACFLARPEQGGGIFNVADDAPAPKAEVVAWLAGRLGVPVPRFTGEPAGGRRAVTPDRIIVNRRAREVLGWVPRYPSYREGYANLLSH